MTATQEQDKDTIEVWEAQTRAAAWVFQRDARRPSGYRQVKVGGPNGTKRIRITTADREFTEEQILDENQHLNPFANGTLKRADGASNESIVTDEDLAEVLALGDEAFEAYLGDLDDELTARRLLEAVKERGRVTQLEMVRNLIEDRWKVGGTQRTVKEMIEAQELAGGETIST